MGGKRGDEGERGDITPARVRTRGPSPPHPWRGGVDRGGGRGGGGGGVGGEKRGAGGGDSGEGGPGLGKNRGSARVACEVLWVPGEVARVACEGPWVLWAPAPGPGPRALDPGPPAPGPGPGPRASGPAPGPRATGPKLQNSGPMIQFQSRVIQSRVIHGGPLDPVAGSQRPCWGRCRRSLVSPHILRF